MLGRPREECPTEHQLGNGPFISERGVDGSSVEIGPFENCMVNAKRRLKHGNANIQQKQAHDTFSGSATTSEEDKSRQRPKLQRVVSQTQALKKQPRSHSCSPQFCTRSQSGWPTSRNTHFFFYKTSGLVVSEFLCQVAEHRENLSKRTDLYSMLQRERETLSPPRKTVSQSGPQTPLSLSAVRMWKKHIRGHCAGTFRR